jgi:nitronate monooxygenase
VATLESAAHPKYIAALVGAHSGEDTVLTTTFSNGWPDAPHRVPATAVRAAEAFDGDDVGFVVEHGEPTPVPCFSVAPPARNVEGHIEAMALYAGTGVGTIHQTQPAADVVADLVSDLPQ